MLVLMRNSYRKVPPDGMGVDVAEDEGGVVLRHDFDVGEAHEFGLGKQVPVRKGEDHGLVKVAQPRGVDGERRVQL